MANTLGLQGDSNFHRVDSHTYTSTPKGTTAAAALSVGKIDVSQRVEGAFVASKDKLAKILYPLAGSSVIIEIITPAKIKEANQKLKLASQGISQLSAENLLGLLSDSSSWRRSWAGHCFYFSGNQKSVSYNDLISVASQAVPEGESLEQNLITKQLLLEKVKSLKPSPKGLAAFLCKIILELARYFSKSSAIGHLEIQNYLKKLSQEDRAEFRALGEDKMQIIQKAFDEIARAKKSLNRDLKDEEILAIAHKEIAKWNLDSLTAMQYTLLEERIKEVQVPVHERIKSAFSQQNYRVSYWNASTHLDSTPRYGQVNHEINEKLLSILSDIGSDDHILQQYLKELSLSIPDPIALKLFIDHHLKIVPIFTHKGKCQAVEKLTDTLKPLGISEYTGGSSSIPEEERTKHLPRNQTFDHIMSVHDIMQQDAYGIYINHRRTLSDDFVKGLTPEQALLIGNIYRANTAAPTGCGSLNAAKCYAHLAKSSIEGFIKSQTPRWSINHWEHEIRFHQAMTNKDAYLLLMKKFKEAPDKAKNMMQNQIYRHIGNFMGDLVIDTRTFTAPHKEYPRALLHQAIVELRDLRKGNDNARVSGPLGDRIDKELKELEELYVIALREEDDYKRKCFPYRQYY